MVKVCFIGISLCLEHAAIERLRSELDVLAQQEPEIEFWFHGFHSDFIKSMLEEVVSLKKRKPNQHIEIVDVVDPIEIRVMKILSCTFNMDTACVELKLDSGSMIAINTIAVENEVADNMYQRSELDYLIYNVPLEYADLILNGDLEKYLKAVTQYKPIDS